MGTWLWSLISPCQFLWMIARVCVCMSEKIVDLIPIIAKLSFNERSQIREAMRPSSSYPTLVLPTPVTFCFSFTRMLTVFSVQTRTHRLHILTHFAKTRLQYPPGVKYFRDIHRIGSTQTSNTSA